jgi:5'-nucleotidase
VYTGIEVERWIIMADLRKLTVLHSNDLHGDFLAENLDETLLGGISMLSGYVNKVRGEEENVLYCIAGDMLQGSIIDSEFKGLSTIEIMNLLAPDVAAIGNHEVDYGLAHLLFLERCAKFPIVNANLFIKNPFTRLFRSHEIIEVGGMKIMFIGIITEEVMMGMKKDLLGSFVDVQDAAQEVGRICNAHRTMDIDFTILLTHIGFDEDKQLAALLDPDWGVDLIIGGHSHTILEAPEIVRGIPVVQAGVGTDQVGRLDILIDADANALHRLDWRLIEISSKECPRDENMENTILRYKEDTDRKYNQIICRFPREMTHPDRYQETELGDLFADILADSLGPDVMFLGSGSLRKYAVPAVLTLGDFMEFFTYENAVNQFSVTGAQLRHMLHHLFRDEMFRGGHTEFFQISRDLRVVFDRAAKAIAAMTFRGEPVDDARLYTVGLQSFAAENFEECFGFPAEDACANKAPRILSTSDRDVILEYFLDNGKADARVDGRIAIL